MFKDIPHTEKQIIFQGLLSLVKANSGVGFGGDQGHPAYAMGRKGIEDLQQWGDSSETNKLFKLMRELSDALSVGDVDYSAEVPERIYTWQDFCQLAYDAYLKHSGRAPTE